MEQTHLVIQQPLQVSTVEIALQEIKHLGDDLSSGKGKKFAGKWLFLAIKIYVQVDSHKQKTKKTKNFPFIPYV